MRPTLTMLTVLSALALPGLSLAHEAEAFEAVAPLPAARIMCVGSAAMPDVLRFAFQPEPAGRMRQEALRTSSRPAPRALQAAPRAAAAAATAIPLLRLPCIQG